MTSDNHTSSCLPVLQPRGLAVILLLMVGFVGLLGATVGASPSVENLATIRYQCSPWDGLALMIQVKGPSATVPPLQRVELVLWGRGLRAAQVGQKSIVVDGHMTEDGMGTLSLCRVERTCTVVVPSRVDFDQADLQEGGIVQGTIVYRPKPTESEQVVPFVGIRSSSTFICG